MATLPKKISLTFDSQFHSIERDRILRRCLAHRDWDLVNGLMLANGSELLKMSPSVGLLCPQTYLVLLFCHAIRQH